MLCSSCGESRPTSAFRKEPQLRRGYRSKCNVCRNAERRARYDPEKNREVTQRKAWNVRAWRYGVSIAELQTLLAVQAGMCAICHKPMVKPCVDHDHDSGRVRGLLCHSCNNLLGLADDSPERLENAKQYLLCCSQAEQPSVGGGVKTE